MPCFEGLLPIKLNMLVLDLSFLFACWHAHAKLRMHTESSLSIFTRLTSQLRSLMRKFKREVDPLDTREIHKECDARAHREINASKKKGKAVVHSGQATSRAKGKISTAKLQKKFSLSTYKYHAMGDYPAMIRAYGMTDSYSTQSVRAFDRLRRRQERHGE